MPIRSLSATLVRSYSQVLAQHWWILILVDYLVPARFNLRLGESQLRRNLGAYLSLGSRPAMVDLCPNGATPLVRGSIYAYSLASHGAPLVQSLLGYCAAMVDPELAPLALEPVTCFLSIQVVVVGILRAPLFVYLIYY